MQSLGNPVSRMSGGTAAMQSSHVLSSLLDEASEHPALNHIWLDHIAEHKYVNMGWALRDYAYQYHGYASAFPTYLDAVINKLDDDRHRQALKHNLDEEKGKLDAIDAEVLTRAGIDVTAIDGVSHPGLYRRFCNALDISDSELGSPSIAAQSWRHDLLAYIAEATPAAAVGAIGLGTESIVKPIYNKLLCGIRKMGGITRDDYVFFELHCIVDDQHAIDLNHIAADLLSEEHNRNELRAGMLQALSLRNRFWDHLHDRAMTLGGGALAS